MSVFFSNSAKFGMASVLILVLCLISSFVSIRFKYKFAKSISIYSDFRRNSDSVAAQKKFLKIDSNLQTSGSVYFDAGSRENFYSLWILYWSLHNRIL